MRDIRAKRNAVGAEGGEFFINQASLSFFFVFRYSVQDIFLSFFAPGGSSAVAVALPCLTGLERLLSVSIMSAFPGQQGYHTAQTIRCELGSWAQFGT